MAFKTLDEDKFKTMNNFLDLAMEKIDTKSFNSFKNSSPLSFNVLLTKKLFIVEILCKPSITIHFPGSLTSK
jgi:hypothetical protein